jgi:CRP-like cAMP-binding protein
VKLILEGWACRYKMLEDGRRQIMAFLLPGDISDARIFVLRQMDHSVATLSAARVAEIPKERFVDLLDRHPRVGRALWWDSLVEGAIQREWTTSLGQRDALERISHLLCEVFIRLRGVGLTQGQSCELPVTQEELGDTTGMSTVHVNRTLSELRESGLIVLKGKQLTIPDLAALKSAAMFNPNYLHLENEGRAHDANDL